MAEPKTEARPARVTATPAAELPQDHVAMVSLTKEGVPDQTAGFTFTGDKETAIEAAKVQFAQQAVSATDEAKRAPGTPISLAGSIEGTSAEGVGSTEPDAAVQELKDAHDAAAKAAEGAAESLVSARFEETK